MEAAVTKVKEEHPVRAEEGFDHRVHIRDRQTGALIRIQHYAKHVAGDQVMFEQPIGSGNMFDQAGSPMGMWKSEVQNRNTIWKKVSEKHKEVPAAPVNQEEWLAQELDAAKAELAAIKAQAQPPQKSK